MEKEVIKEYAARIAQASKTELVVITYEIINNYIEDAMECYKNQDLEGFRFNIKKAKQFVNDLQVNLDFNYKLSFELMSLYLYINKWLVSSSIRKSAENLPLCQRIIASLKNAFSQVAKTDKRCSAMPNSEQIYAGLTYGKSSMLNEVYIR